MATMLRWTRTENGVYVASGFRVYKAEGGGWALVMDGKAMGRFQSMADAKRQAERWMAGR